MELPLQQEDASVLRRVLEASLSDLRAEVGKTENYEMRQGLKHDEETLKTIIARLTSAGA